MRRLCATVIATVALGAGLGAPDGAGARSSVARFSAAQVRALTSIAVAGFAASGSPGMIVGIWVPGEGSYVRTFGVSDIQTGAPLSTTDSVRIASNTKTFVATAILQLVDRHKLSLNARLDRFVKGVPYGNRITVRQLLNMTAGVYNYTDDPAFTKDYLADPLMPFSLQDLLSIINRHQPRYPPGGPAQYDDSNYWLLGVIVEAVTHKPLGEVIKSQILKPLKLTHTSYPTTSAMPAPFARGYYPVPDGLPRDVTASNPAAPAGGGAMISTLGDMKIWVKALATGSLLRRTTQTLRLRTNVLSSTPHITTRYGMGIADVNGFLGHNGGIVGYNTAMFYLPRKRATIVVLLNGGALTATTATSTFVALAAYLFPRQFPNGL